MSRRDTESHKECDCYQAGKDVTDLLCQGCKHCQRLHEQWEWFEDDVDDVVPLALRSIGHGDTETPETNDASAETTARRVVYDFIARFGAPLELHMDQGHNFESSLFNKVCRLLQISKTRTTPYHPASNVQVEWFNRTLLQMIRGYVDQNQRNWDEHLPLLTSAYRSSQHAITGFTPNRLMLGREVHQPQDIWSGTVELKANRMEAPEFLYDLEEGLKEAHNVAREQLSNVRKRRMT
ncbi:hypothetical protein SKAU_G00218270 [Synaphobranchus kaupii]|uniref:Integrase catalytic domain-containing protein n=1 Tax=Synaphobranchus kaupii TaxID=118154 RepID=A0A9Q1FAG5_SYNKA|nr:hypothetical protein SKAU_G00218270 [Synaphobranchus kaupii]